MNHQPNTPASLNEAVAAAPEMLAMLQRLNAEGEVPQSDLLQLIAKATASASAATINRESATAYSLLAALVDIHDDEQKNAPEDRCYVESAWGDCMRTARVFLAAPGAAIDAREQETKPFAWVPIAITSRGEPHTLWHLATESEWVKKRDLDEMRHEIVALYRNAPSEALSPATVAQPVTDEQIDALLDADADVLDIVSDKRARLRRFARKAIALAQPCASQGCGGLVERLKQEAQIHAQEARTANSTIADIYRVVTGGTGEPGNWNGAEPVRKCIEDLRAQVAALSTDKSGGAA